MKDSNLINKTRKYSLLISIVACLQVVFFDHRINWIQLQVQKVKKKPNKVSKFFTFFFYNRFFFGWMTLKITNLVLKSISRIYLLSSFRNNFDSSQYLHFSLNSNLKGARNVDFYQKIKVWAAFSYKSQKFKFSEKFRRPLDTQFYCVRVHRD